MNECRYMMFGRCNLLVDTRCKSDCKFKKTDEEFILAASAADELLTKKGLEKVIVTDSRGCQIVTTKPKKP